MERFQFEVAIQILTKLEAEAQSALDGFMAIPYDRRDEYVEGSIAYWRHCVKAMRWAKGRVKMSERKHTRKPTDTHKEGTS